MGFTKLHGLGNDYVYVDCFAQTIPANLARLAQKSATAISASAANGLILICPSEKADARMRLLNADGSESEMCGNGIRCVAKFVTKPTLYALSHS